MPEAFIEWRTKVKDELLLELVAQGFVPEYAEELTDSVFVLVDRAYEYGVRDA